MFSNRIFLFLILVVSTLLTLLTGCEQVGCLGGEDECVVPSPCRKLTFECPGGPAVVKVIEWGDEIPGGLQAQGAAGDILLANDRVLAVGHVEYHNPAVQAALELAQQVRYLEAQRLSPFTARSVDVDVILDLMIHDMQITLAVAGETPSDVRAVGVPVLTDKVDLCHAWIEFPSGLVANLTASRVSAERVRKLRLFARDSYFSVDYADQSVSSAQLFREEGKPPQIAPRVVEVVEQEPLKAELEAFIAACRGESSSAVDGRTGRDALAVAVAIREQVEAR